jgi:hypothetical protein
MIKPGRKNEWRKRDGVWISSGYGPGGSFWYFATDPMFLTTRILAALRRGRTE